LLRATEPLRGGLTGELGEAPFETFEFALGEVFEIQQFIARGFIDPNQLVELEMQPRAISVLRVG
jgi:hypothetical protein